VALNCICKSLVVGERESELIHWPCFNHENVRCLFSTVWAYNTVPNLPNHHYLKMSFIKNLRCNCKPMQWVLHLNLSFLFCRIDGHFINYILQNFLKGPKHNIAWTCVCHIHLSEQSYWTSWSLPFGNARKSIWGRFCYT